MANPSSPRLPPGKLKLGACPQAGFYIADGDGQGFRDDDRQQAFPDYD